MSRILLVEDQTNVRRAMALLLTGDGHAVLEAGTAADALKLSATSPVDVVLTDVRIEGDGDGVDLLKALKSRDPDLEVVLITAFGTIDDAVAAIKSGAYDYLTKPADPDRLLLTVRRAAERNALAREVRQLRAQMGDQHRIVAVSRQMQQVLATVAQLATTDSTVLLTGESGTGKELIARALYAQSERRTRRFVPVNCGAIPESILESELFGHRKGAFTGAIIDKKGLVEEADGGVLFLDEIGDMPAAMQVRLLRFLQGGEVRRIGETTTRRVDVRLVAATHRNLEEEVAHGRFRQDFYYRINVVGVRIPPLRERVDDIGPLADYFLQRTATRFQRQLSGFTAGALELMQAYDWPGNARELENAIERAVNLASGPLLSEADLPATLTVRATQASVLPQAGGSVSESAERDERMRLVETLENCRWNQGRAAAALGISRTTLWRKMREHRIQH
jgi:DNA-binding NtrC family response regulator